MPILQPYQGDKPLSLCSACVVLYDLHDRHGSILPCFHPEAFAIDIADLIRYHTMDTIQAMLTEFHQVCLQSVTRDQHKHQAPTPAQ